MAFEGGKGSLRASAEATDQLMDAKINAAAAVRSIAPVPR
jgi:hypothetical protein